MDDKKKNGAELEDEELDQVTGGFGSKRLQRDRIASGAETDTQNMTGGGTVSKSNKEPIRIKIRIKNIGKNEKARNRKGS